MTLCPTGGPACGVCLVSRMRSPGDFYGRHVSGMCTRCLLFARPVVPRLTIRTECYLTSQCTVRQSAHSKYHYGDSTQTASSYEDAVADHTAAADHSSLALGSAVLIGREMQ